MPCGAVAIEVPAATQPGPQDTASTMSVVTRPGGRRAPMPPLSLVMRPGVRPNGLAARAGRLLRTVAVGQGEHALAVDERGGRVFVTNAGDDSVSVLDARSGQVLRTTSVGQSPLAVAVVASLKHVFVANGGLWHNGHQVTPGGVSVLDERSGAVVHAVPVGGSPGPLVVHERT